MHICLTFTSSTTRKSMIALCTCMLGSACLQLRDLSSLELHSCTPSVPQDVAVTEDDLFSVNSRDTVDFILMVSAECIETQYLRTVVVVVLMYEVMM